MTSVEEPKCYREAMSSENSEDWFRAMTDEMESLKGNDVWDLVELPENKRVIPTKWIFKIKRDKDNKPIRF